MKAEEFAARAPDEVLNQPPPLENYNLFESDRPLREAVAALAQVRALLGSCNFLKEILIQTNRHVLLLKKAPASSR